MSVLFCFFHWHKRGNQLKTTKTKSANGIQKHQFHITRLSVVNTQIFLFIFLLQLLLNPGETDVDFLKEVKHQSQRLSMRSWVPLKGKGTGGSEKGQTGRECELKSLCRRWRSGLLWWQRWRSEPGARVWEAWELMACLWVWHARAWHSGETVYHLEPRCYWYDSPLGRVWTLQGERPRSGTLPRTPTPMRCLGCDMILLSY